VGKTSANYGTAGQEFRQGGAAIFGTNGGEALVLNRLTSDGGILQVRKDNAIVGSIGVAASNNLYIGSSATNHTGLIFPDNNILPAKELAAVDNFVDLGDGTRRFKDLYLSGDVNLGGDSVASNINVLGDVFALDVDSNGNSGGTPSIQFKQGGSEKMRLSGGNLLVGKTASSFTTAGVEIQSSGRIELSRSGELMNLNRLGSDGNLMTFYGSSALVGSIGTASGQLGVNSQGTRLNLQLGGTTKAYVRSGSLNPSGDNTFDLGESSERFKDLYLSDTVYAGVRVCIGTTETPRPLTVNGLAGFRNSTTGFATSDGFDIGVGGSDAYIVQRENANIIIETNGSEAARIDSSGNLLVGTTEIGPVTDGARLMNDGQVRFTSIGTVAYLNRSGTAGTIQEFRQANTSVGYISVTGSATAYNTSSDQRLKENIADADDAGSKVDSIQVRKFDWKADGSHQDYGMIAQELQAVAPEAVSGDADSEEMMGVDYSKLVPMLIKEIQSLRNRVAQLEE
jgi:hypothetical protein